MKMKMSVILGITQMLFGVCLKTSNAIYFRKPLDLVFECLPMIVFATCLFGYMVFLIFYKWSIDWNNGVDGMYVKLVFVIHVGGTRCVPSSTDNIMNIRARITLTVEFIRGYIFIFLFYV